MKLLLWNVNGIRAAWKKDLPSLIEKQSPDVLCLQEVKAWEEQLTDEQKLAPHYLAHFSEAEKKGYSGVATFVKPSLEPKKITQKIGVKKFESEGRFLITEHKEFTIYNVYFPSGTTGELRQNFKYDFLDAFLSHLKNLPAKKRNSLLICGDFNICHKDIDIHHPREAEKRELSGFLPRERAWMDSFVDLGFVDAFRHIHGEEKDAYTWWTFRANARAKNLGWRIDYWFVSRKLAEKIKNAGILSSVKGSDHCPVTLELAL